MNRIAIARTDSIGDVMLTLPMAGILKATFPMVQIVFIGKSYTKPVIQCCKNVDQFVNWDELKTSSSKVTDLKNLDLDAIVFALPNLFLAQTAFRAQIPKRIGVSRRWFHWMYCNDRPTFSRRKSNLHEAQLNIKLLENIVPSVDYNLLKLGSMVDFSPKISLPQALRELLGSRNPKIIVHPKSQGSAREWGLTNFRKFADMMVKKGAKVFVTGTENEGQLVRPHFKFGENIIDLTGKMDLHELIGFINCSDGLVAASTGPLHIAAALGKKTIGLYSTVRPIHPGRWAPIGKNAKAITFEGEIDPRLKVKDDTTLELIKPERIVKEFESLF